METKRPTAPFENRGMIVTAVLVTVAVRLYLLWQYYCINSDGVRYIATARDFFSGHIAAGFASYDPPGYPVLIAAIFPLVGEWELAGQIVSLFFGILLLWPLYHLFREVYDARVAGIACILAGLSPFLARYSVHVRSESPFLFFSTLALLLFYQGIQTRRLGRFLWGGLVAGFGYLIRPEALGFLIIVPGFLGFFWLLRKEPDGLWRIKAATVCCAAFMLLALPFITYLSIETGRWGAMSRKAGVTLAISLQQYGLLQADEGENAPTVESVGFLDFVHHHPIQYLRRVGMGFFPTFGVFFEALHFSYVPFLLVGLYFVFRDKFWQRKDFLILAFVGFYLLAFLLIYVKRRYSLQVVPVSLGWVAVGMLWIWDSLRASLPIHRARVLWVLIVLSFIGGTLPKTLTAISREKSYVRETGRYLKERNSSGQLNVAVWDERVPFYAQANTLSLAGVEESKLATWCHDKRADYVAVEKKAWQKFYPGVASHPDAYGLVLEREFVGYRKDRMLLFKVNTAIK